MKKKTSKKPPEMTIEQWKALGTALEVMPYVLSEVIERAERGNRTAKCMLRDAHRKLTTNKRIEAFRRMMHG